MDIDQVLQTVRYVVSQMSVGDEFTVTEIKHLGGIVYPGHKLGQIISRDIGLLGRPCHQVRVPKHNAPHLDDISYVVDQ